MKASLSNNPSLENMLFPKTITKIDSKRHFLAKLLQPSILPHLKDYLKWQVEIRQSPNQGEIYSKMPDTAPISINLDPTSACNFGCPHCVDMDILNTGVQYNLEKLKDSLALMHKRGLRSVIIIGGGEPTLYRGFEDLVYFLKERKMQVAVVTNGTGMDKILNVGNLFQGEDYVRLSLDSSSEEKFHAMHLPKGKMIKLPSGDKVPITLDDICGNTEYVKSQYPNLTIGYSYIVTWPGAKTNNLNIESNIEEIITTADRAKKYKFDYIAFKAFLDREDEGCHAEVIGINKSLESYNSIINAIHRNIEYAKELETNSFKVYIATNLRALLDSVEDRYKTQPVNCHMTNFRQVLGIRGISICPSYRAEAEAKIGDMLSYSSEENYKAIRINTAERIRNFDASQRCNNVVCMYMDANWFIENLIQKELSDPGTIDKLQSGPELNDYFL